VHNCEFRTGKPLSSVSFGVDLVQLSRLSMFRPNSGLVISNDSGKEERSSTQESIDCQMCVSCRGQRSPGQINTGQREKIPWQTGMVCLVGRVFLSVPFEGNEKVPSTLWSTPSI